MTEKKKIGGLTMALLIINALMVALNAAAWLSTGLTDFYAENIFAPLSDIFSIIIGKIPFSLGEVLIAAGIILVIAAPIIFIRLLIKKNSSLAKKVGRVYAVVLTYIFAAETLNCFMLYHTTELSEKYHGSKGAEGFTVTQLVTLCEETILSANELAQAVNRDIQGNVNIPDNLGEIAEEAMNELSQDYPLLKGAYASPKKIKAAVLMTQFDLQGIYFPFTLEANYNSELSPARVPCTVMHELSHTKGFLREDEACFIAYRACLKSKYPEVRYSGYLSAMNYLFNAVSQNASSSEIQQLREMISPLVRKDNYFVSEEFKNEITQKAVIPTNVASSVSEKSMEATLILNGISDGKKSYSRMVNLLLEYRYCIQ